MNDPIQFAKQVAELVRDQVTRATAPLLERLATLESRPEPVIGKDGSPGKDGSDGLPGPAAPAPTRADLEPLVADYLAANPPAAGQDGAPGRDGVDAPAITDEQLQRAVAAHLAAYPIPVGRDGRDGLPGTAGEKGMDGAPGQHGKDAFDLDDIDLSLDQDGRTVRLRFMRGADVREKTVTLPTLLDRGVYKAGQSYEKGDGVSWGGSFFIAQKETTALPDQSDEWRLAVKRGRDGNRGRDASTKAPEPYRSRL